MRLASWRIAYETRMNRKLHRAAMLITGSQKSPARSNKGLASAVRDSVGKARNKRGIIGHMEPDTAATSNGLRLFSKVLGVGYLLNAALILYIGIARSILIFNAMAAHASELNPLVMVPSISFVIICLLFVAGLTALSLRLFAGKQGWPTWTLAVLFLMSIPIGTVLGILTIVWLILSRRAERQPVERLEPRKNSRKRTQKKTP